LAKFADAIKSGSVANVAILSDYVSNQRPASSNSWSDLMMLGLSSIVIDSDSIGDYPYNIRLYTRLDPEDWAKIRIGKPFAASEFSLPVREQLMDVLLQSRARDFARSQADPARWDTLDFSKLTVTASIVEKPVLIGYTMMGGEVEEVNQAATNYEMRRKDLGREPLYQPGTRRKLALKISSTGDEQTVTTSFSEVLPGKTKAVAWRELPTDMAAEFKKAYEDYQRLVNAEAGKPPP
jgi:hypothetical protein